ncbi:uncharacterized protein LOC143030467 [Oratosquilla oratoria]|uniref:uncharacterized protein LOC143030467 n=1 Tax=Oratosquilla oratoria TaxID=337810 RepID=UPI003F75DFA4
MYRALQLVGKRQTWGSVGSTTPANHASTLQSVRDDHFGLSFLVDTGSAPAGEYTQILQNFPQLTSPYKATTIRPHNIVHHIQTTGPPVYSKPRYLSLEKLAAAKQEFQELLDQDFHFKIHWKQVFSKVNLLRASHQIPVASEDFQKTVIITPFGLFEWRMMPFGLRNIAQTFHHFMNHALRDFNFVAVFIDDILVAGADLGTNTATISASSSADCRITASRYAHQMPSRSTITRLPRTPYRKDVLSPSLPTTSLSPTHWTGYLTTTHRVSRQLSFLSQYDTHFKCIKGEDNHVADALSKITCSVTPEQRPIDYALIAASQTNDRELHSLRLGNTSSLHLQQLPNTPALVWMCSRRSTTSVNLKFGSRRLAWNQQRRQRMDPYLPYLQSSNVTRHVHAPLHRFLSPTKRFRSVLMDIVGPLPPSRGMRYLPTCIDRYTRWPETIPQPDICAETTARAFLSGWVSRFGAPHAIITHRGAHFESDLWSRLLKFLGTNRNRTTAYHPQANELVERFHRQLKESLKAHEPSYGWVGALPLVLLSIHNTSKVDSDVSPSQLVYAEDLRFPEEIATPAVADHVFVSWPSPSSPLSTPSSPEVLLDGTIARSGRLVRRPARYSQSAHATP